jgi:hypothetical protein
MMGVLAAIFTPKVHGVNCTYDEWRKDLRISIVGALQDEQEHGEFYGEQFALVLLQMLREFPQATFREFVMTCGNLAADVRQFLE